MRKTANGKIATYHGVMHQRKTMKIIVFILTVIVSVQLQAQSVSCDGAPKDSTTELPSPIDKWAVVFCSPKGHVIGATDGNLWIAPNGKPFMFQASPKPAPDSSRHSSYFTGAAHRKLKGQLKTNTNKMLAKATQKEDQSLQPWQLDITSNQGFRYNIFFYEKSGVILYVLGCINQCQHSVLLRNKTLDQIKKELDENA